MKKTILICGLLTSFAATALAQDPAPELKKLERMIGSWEGAGTVWENADAEGSAWTAVGISKWILGGHFLQDDLRVDLGEGVPAPLIFRSFMGWDAEKGRFISCGIDNMAGGGHTVPEWLDSNKIVTVNHGTEGGIPFVERDTTWLKEDSYSFQVDRANGDGPFFKYVEGTFKKVEPSVAAKAAEASMTMVPASEQMLRANVLAGTYAIKGKRVEKPGSAPIDYEAELHIEELFAGSAMTGHFKGTKGYEGFGYLYWNGEKERFGHFTVNNLGVLSHTEGRWVGDKLVFTAEKDIEGVPSVTRWTMDVGENGLSHVAIDLLHGSAEPARIFDASYTRSSSAMTMKFKEGSCCAKAAAAGAPCPHPCCAEAAKEALVCAKCN